MASLPLVPLTTTLSVWPSPVLPPRVAARSVLTVFTSVPVRSLTVTVSAPPRALKSTCLDAGGVHGDVALGAEEPEAMSVG